MATARVGGEPVGECQPTARPYGARGADARLAAPGLTLQAARRRGCHARVMRRAPRRGIAASAWARAFASNAGTTPPTASRTTTSMLTDRTHQPFAIDDADPHVGSGDAGPPVPGGRHRGRRGGAARPRPLSPVTARLFDADGHDRRSTSPTSTSRSSARTSSCGSTSTGPGRRRRCGRVAACWSSPMPTGERLASERSRAAADSGAPGPAPPDARGARAARRRAAPARASRDRPRRGAEPRRSPSTPARSRRSSASSTASTARPAWAPSTPRDLLSSLVDEVIVGYYQLAEMIEREIDDLDQRALHGRPRRRRPRRHRRRIRRRIGLSAGRSPRTAKPWRPRPARDARRGDRRPAVAGRWSTGWKARSRAIDGLRDSLLGTYDIHMGRVVAARQRRHEDPDPAVRRCCCRPSCWPGSWA